MLRLKAMTHAPESRKTQKAREKLKKHWLEIDKCITPEALGEKIDEIHRWISRHAHHRILLRNKNISLFDENQNAAQISQRVRMIAQKLYSNNLKNRELSEESI